MNLAVQKTEGGVVFNAKIVPGSSRTTVGGLLGDMLKVKVAAAPEKGKANKRLVEYLAGLLGVTRKDIRIVSGQTGPVKRLEVNGISPETLLARLNLNEGAGG